MNSIIFQQNIPSNYTSPNFPGLGFPAFGQASDTSPYTLWYQNDIVEYFVIWATILHAILYIPLIYWHPILWMIGTATGALSGMIVGFVLSALYTNGGFSMGTWIPIVWAILQVGIVWMSSFSEVVLNVM